MANWSDLPSELLEEITKRLESPICLLRFRSVCSSWRSSVSLRPRNLHGRFPFLPNDGISETRWGFRLWQRTVFLVVSPPPEDSDRRRARDPWLVKVEDGVPGRVRLLNPLSRFQTKPLPEDFPEVLDLSKFRVFELGQEFVLRYIHCANSLGNVSDLYMEKVVLKFLDSETNNFALLTIHVSGKLAVCKYGDERWTIIHNMPSQYDDVVLFGGDFYAIDRTGRLVVVDLSANVAMVSSPVFGGKKKFLVESSGELLMVDMYLRAVFGFGDDGFDELCKRTVGFKVYRLDREEKKWIEVKSLGDQVLFLGDYCTFSASTRDLSCCKNCIFFMGNFFCNDGKKKSVFRGCDIGVYDMENAIIAPLADYPERSQLFWPPPDWIAPRTPAATPTDSVEAKHVQAQF